MSWRSLEVGMAHRLRALLVLLPSKPRERHVPVLPFCKEAVALPRLRKTLAAYCLAFGQPRQEELIEFLGADRSDAEFLLLASRLRIDLSPPEIRDGVICVR